MKGLVEGVFLMGKHLHFVWMREEVLNMVSDQDAETSSGLRGAREAGLEARKNECKGIMLNKIQKLLLTVEVVVETGQRDTGSAADVADGSALETLVGEDTGGMAEDVVELGFGIAGTGDRGRHSEYRTIVRYCKTTG
jgi:hypothetical protein